MFERLLSKGGLSLERLRTLIAVAEACGITLAAKGDPATQSLYSRQIRELEEFFGVKLVTRKGKGVAMTSAGTRLVTVARGCLLSLEGFLVETGKQKARFEIGAGDSVLQWKVIPDCLAQVVRQTGCEVRLHNLKTEEIVTGLRELTLDFGLVRDSAITPPLQSQRLFHSGYALFVPEALIPTGHRLVLREILHEVPLALLSDSSVMDALQSVVAPNELKVGAMCDSFTQAASALLTGRFGAVLPTIASSSLPQGQFRMIELKELQAMKRTVHLAWNPRMLALRPRATDVQRILRSALEVTSDVVASRKSAGRRSRS